MRFITGLLCGAVMAVPAVLAAPEAHPQSGTTPTAEELSAQIQTLKAEYAERMEALEARLAEVREQPKAAAAANAFNPAVGVVLDGRASSFSVDDHEIPGFRLGHEAERGAEGLSLGHTEITLSSNVDDKFRGNVTLGLGVHPGEPVELELEEAYVQTLPGMGLPDGMRLKAGRALWTFGYLNELHAHADDFADRPLPNRVYLDNAFNDDGVEVSWVLPTDMYGEVGAGLFRGDDVPFGGSENGFDAWSAYARVGGDVGHNSAWRVGAYLLDGKARNRGGAGAHGHGEHGHGEEEHADHEDEHDEEEEHADHEDEHDDGEEHAEGGDAHDSDADFLNGGMFSGDSRTFGIDVRYTWAPTGNPRDSELILQGEYFWRTDEGAYRLTETEDGEEVEHTKHLDAVSSGWYAQAVYKFLPNWRLGVRYAQLEPPSEAGVDHSPYAIAVMGDWSNSEFGRLRLQYNREALEDGVHDNQYILQYIMSLGAHAAHAF